MRSSEIIAKAIKDYTKIQIKNNEPIDSEYIVHFYQKYKWTDKWEECTVIGYIEDFPIGSIYFSDDFYEGQTEVKDVCVMSLHEVGSLISKTFELAKKIEKEIKEHYEIRKSDL